MGNIRKKEKKDIQPATIKLTDKDLENLRSNTEVIIGCSSILGDRNSQQDSYAAGTTEKNQLTYGIVCDGMGGMDGGETASKTATEFLRKCIEKLSELCEENEDQDVREALFHMMKQADNAVDDLTDENGKKLRCGTTAVICIIKNGLLFWASVGDSRIYITRGEGIFALTNDHNYDFMAEQRKNDEDFIFNPEIRRDALVSYLGMGRLPYIDLNMEPFNLVNGDKIILCSDGLYKSLSDEQIRGIFLSEETDMERAASMLTAAASMNQATNRDNTTVIVFKYIN